MKSGNQFISGREEKSGRTHVITDVAAEFAYAEETVIQQSIICRIVKLSAIRLRNAIFLIGSGRLFRRKWIRGYC